MRRTLILSFIAFLVVLVVAFFAFVAPGGRDRPQEDDGEGKNIFGTLFPFNFGGEKTSPGSEKGGGAPAPDTRLPPPLREISNSPTAGGFVYPNQDGDILIRYVDRATGHVFETSAQSLSAERISNTTIPGIQQVLFADENRFIIRSINDEGTIENFYIHLAEGTREQAIQGNFLRAWERGALDSSGENLFVVDETNNGSSLYISSANGQKERLVLASAIRSWVPLQSDTGLYVYTAPSAGVPGFLYHILGGSLIKVAGDALGMSAKVSSDGRYVFFSDTKTRLDVTLLDTEANRGYSGILETLPEKCAFIPGTSVQIICGVPTNIPQGAYPDDWLLGRVGFSDDIWIIEPTEGRATLIAVPKDDVGRDIDVWQPMVDETGTYLSFINKNDLTFWTLQLKETEEETENADN